MALDLSVIQEVVIDDSKAVAGAERVVAAQQKMAAAADTADAAVKKQASGFGVLDAAIAKAGGSQESALRRLNAIKAASDDNERVMQRLARAEMDLNRAVQQGLATNDERIAIMGRLEAKLRSVGAANDNFVRGAAGAAGSAGRFGSAIQQAGYQVGDFAVQVASGQGVLRPLIQQGTQLISVFGPWGAVLGAVAAIIGAVATAFIGMIDAEKGAAEAAKQVDTALKATNDVLKDHQQLGAALKDQQADEMKRVADLARYYRSLTGDLRDFEKVRLEIRKNDLEEQSAGLRTQTDAGLGSIGSITRVAQNALDLAEQSNRRRAALGATPLAGPPEQILQAKAALDVFNAASEKSPEAIRQLYVELFRTSQLEGPFSKSLLEAAKAIEKPAMQAGDLKTRLDEVNTSIKLLGQSNEKLDAMAGAPDAIKKAQDQAKALQKLYADQAAQQDKDRAAAQKRGEEIIALDAKRNSSLEAYIKGLEDAGTVDGRNTTEKKVQDALLTAQNKLVDDQGHKLRDLTDAEKNRVALAVRTSEAYEAQRAAQKQFEEDTKRSADRTADRLVDFAGDSIFDRLTGKAANFWDSFRDWGFRAISQLAAEMIFRPFIVPAATANVSARPAMFGISAKGSAV